MWEGIPQVSCMYLCLDVSRTLGEDTIAATAVHGIGTARVGALHSIHTPSSVNLNSRVNRAL